MKIDTVLEATSHEFDGSRVRIEGSLDGAVYITPVNVRSQPTQDSVRLTPEQVTILREILWADPDVVQREVADRIMHQWQAEGRERIANLVIWVVLSSVVVAFLAGYFIARLWV